MAGEELVKLTRRQFLQGLGAALVVASAPPAVRAIVAEEASEELSWGFIVRGLPQPDLIMLPPGVRPGPGIETLGTSPFTYYWPEPFNVEKLIYAAERDQLNDWIELSPWGPYRPQMEVLIPADLRWKSRNWKPRRYV